MTDPLDREPEAPEPGAGHTPAPDPERLVGGRYRLGEIIGRGGMATVHRAVDTQLGRLVAVKLLRREVLADVDISMRFRREALAATVLRHPNIVACLEAGTDDGQPFLVMELVEGEDLAARLRRVGRLAPGEAARIGLDVARALGVAHLRGIVHRDVKPGNILLARDGRAMVTDFGIARLAADAEGAVPGTTLGSVQYFSPEQARGITTTPASDVYGLGLVLYEALTGRRAWSGDSTTALIAARLEAVAPSPRALQPDIPAALDAIVVQALDPDPGHRFPSGHVMAAALEPLVARPDPASQTVGLERPWTPTRSVVRGGPAPRGRRASVVVAGPLVLLVAVATIIGGALLAAWLPGVGRPPATVPPPVAATPVAEAPAAGSASIAVSPASVTPTGDDPTETAKPQPSPVPTPRPPGPNSGDLCDPFFGFACGLGPGRYQPSGFEPAVRFDLDEGWAVAVRSPTFITLERGEGRLTFAGPMATVQPKGDPEPAPATMTGLVDALIGTDGVAAGKPASGRVGKRPATILDLAPTGRDPVRLLATSSEAFVLDPRGTTRVIVVDGRRGVFVVAIEPSADSTLESILPLADPVVASLRFR